MKNSRPKTVKRSRLQPFDNVSLGGKCQRPQSGEIRENHRIAPFVSTEECRELHEIAWALVVSEWQIIPGDTAAQLVFGQFNFNHFDNANSTLGAPGGERSGWEGGPGGWSWNCEMSYVGAGLFLEQKK